MVGAPVSAVPDQAVQTSQKGQRLLGGAISETSETNEIVNFKLHATCIHAKFLQIEVIHCMERRIYVRKLLSS